MLGAGRLQADAEDTTAFISEGNGEGMVQLFTIVHDDSAGKAGGPMLAKERAQVGPVRPLRADTFVSAKSGMRHSRLQ